MDAAAAAFFAGHGEAPTARLYPVPHTIEVHDNGIGFDVDKVASNNHGLSGMRHRVEAGGGRLTVTSEKGSGSHIHAVLPKTA